MFRTHRKDGKAFLHAPALFFVLLAGWAGLSASGIQRSQRIPGIDPLPLAPDTAAPGESREPDKSVTPGRTDTNPSDPGYPKLRNITVVPEPTQPYTAKISWDLYPDSNTPIYLVRFSKPIVNRAVLYESYNLTSPALPAEAKVFLDRDLPEGTYYYAAVTAFELSKDGRLELRPGVNYTLVPFVVYRQDRPHGPTNEPAEPRTKPETAQSDRDPTLTPADFYVQSLSLTDSEKGVVLNWDPIQVKGIEYEIFRGPEPLDSNERIEKAARLGRVQEDTPFFSDDAPVEGKSVYYGVAVHDRIVGTNYRDLKFRSSYLDHTYRKPERQVRYENFLPDSLTAFLANRETVQLVWVDPGPSVKEYRVFRSTLPISSPDMLKKSKDLGVALPGGAGFTDSGLSGGNYFYALLPVTTAGEMLQVFVPGQTFTTFGVMIRGLAVEENRTEKTEEVKTDVASLSGFRIDLNDQDVHLGWTVKPGSKPKTMIRVYRGAEVLDEIEALKKKGKLLGEFSVEEGFTVDHLTDAGSYFYTVAEYDPAKEAFLSLFFSRKPLVFKPAKAEKPDARKSTETQETKKPVDSGKPVTGDGTESQDTGPYAKRLEEILSGTFARGQFDRAEALLEEFLADPRVPSSVRSKGGFYLGIVKFRLRKYAEALRIFRDPAVQAHDRERVSFWYRICLERMQK